MEKPLKEERRRYPRLSANFFISYKIKKIPNDYDFSQTINIGQGGVLLTTNRQFEPGTQLALMVKLPFLPQRLEILATVVDSKEISRDLIYETRLAFSETDKKFIKDLGEFIGKRLRK